MRGAVRVRLGLYAVFALASACAAHRVYAQDTRLESRLDSTTRTAVAAIIDSARAQGLPLEPLYDRAFEGSIKGIPGPRIVAAVHALATNLGLARQALLPFADDDEVYAGATALHAGFTSEDLARLRRAAPRRHLTRALTAVADLASRNVPVATVADVIASLLANGVTDPEIVDFLRDIRGDLSRGADPRSATLTRARGLIAQRQSAVDSPR